MKICINIGHGGKDSGAISQDGLVQEHSWNRDVLFPELRECLEDNGHTVIKVIQVNSFSELPPVINALNPDLILSLHLNASNGKGTGTESLYWKSSLKSKALAQCIQKRMVEALQLPDRGIKALGLQDRGNALCRRTNASCVILEPFFVDNPKDLIKGRNLVDELARGIAQGVEDWIVG